MLRNRAGEIINEKEELEPIKGFIDEQIKMSQVGGDLGTLAFLQAMQNMNLMTQSLMKQSILDKNTASTNGIGVEDIREIVKTVVMEIMKELGAEVK